MGQSLVPCMVSPPCSSHSSDTGLCTGRRAQSVAQDRYLITHMELLLQKGEIRSQTQQDEHTLEEPKNLLGSSENFGLYKTK